MSMKCSTSGILSVSRREQNEVGDFKNWLVDWNRQITIALKYISSYFGKNKTIMHLWNHTVGKVRTSTFKTRLQLTKPKQNRFQKCLWTVNALTCPHRWNPRQACWRWRGWGGQWTCDRWCECGSPQTDHCRKKSVISTITLQIFISSTTTCFSSS